MRSPDGVAKSIHHVLPRLVSDIFVAPLSGSLATLAEVQNILNANIQQDHLQETPKIFRALLLVVAPILLGGELPLGAF